MSFFHPETLWAPDCLTRAAYSFFKALYCTLRFGNESCHFTPTILFPSPISYDLALTKVNSSENKLLRLPQSFLLLTISDQLSGIFLTSNFSHPPLLTLYTFFLGELIQTLERVPQNSYFQDNPILMTLDLHSLANVSQIQ